MKRCNIACSVVVLVSVAVGNAWGGYQYSVTTITCTSPNYVENVTGINNSGQVVGTITNSQGNNTYAFLYSNGTFTNLGNFSSHFNVSDAFGINAGGQVVGSSETSNGNYDAFLYSNGKMTDLGCLSGVGLARATGINNSGVVVGWAQLSNGDHAFLYSGGQMTDLGLGRANAINASGQVVGDNLYQACLYSGGTTTILRSFPATLTVQLIVSTLVEVSWAGVKLRGVQETPFSTITEP